MLKPVELGRARWSAKQIDELKEILSSFRGDLTETAAAMGRSEIDCDIALFASIGRTSPEAELAIGDNYQRWGTA